MKRSFKKTEDKIHIEEFADFLKNDDGSLIIFELDFEGNEYQKHDKEDGVDSSPSKKIKIAEERIKVTSDVISSWVKLLKENFPVGLGELASGLKAGVCFSSSSNNESLKYEVSSIEVHQIIISTATTEMITYLRKYLSLQAQKSKNSSPSSSHKWKNIQPIMEDYLESALQLLDDKDMKSLELGLKHLINLPQFYLCFPQFVGALIEKLDKLWSQSHKELQALVQQCLSSLISLANESVTKFTFCKLYMSLMTRCNDVTATTIVNVTTLRKNLVEILCLKPKSAHVFIATYLSQMRKNFDDIPKKKDAAREACNWQYLNSLATWAEVVGVKKDDEKLKELLSPIMNMVLDVVGSNFSPLYVPMRMFCAKILLDLSRGCGLFIPSILSIILEPLKWRLFEDTAESSNLTSFSYSLRFQVEKVDLKEKAFRDETINQVIDLLLDFSISQSHSIAFPELMQEAFRKMKEFKESCLTASYIKKLEQVINKIKIISDKIEKKRKFDTPDLKDKLALVKWEKESESNELKKYYDNWIKERSKQQEQALKDETASVKKDRKTNNGKPANKYEDSDSGEDMDVDDDDDGDDGDDDEEDSDIDEEYDDEDGNE